jgi:HEAT repeat protein
MAPVKIKNLRFLVTIVIAGAILFVSCKSTPLEQKLMSADAAVRAKGFEKLNKLSVEKKNRLIPILVGYLRNDDSRVVDRASDALVAMGDATTDTFISLMQEQDVYIRLTAITALGEMGSPAQKAVPNLIAALKDPHPLIREESARSIGALNPDPTTVKVALTEVATKDKSRDVRAAAVESLKKLGIGIEKTKKKST